MICKHVVKLSAEERTRLERLVATGKNSAATLVRVRISKLTQLTRTVTRIAFGDRRWS